MRADLMIHMNCRERQFPRDMQLMQNIEQHDRIHAAAQPDRDALAAHPMRVQRGVYDLRELVGHGCCHSVCQNKIPRLRGVSGSIVGCATTQRTAASLNLPWAISRSKRASTSASIGFSCASVSASMSALRKVCMITVGSRWPPPGGSATTRSTSPSVLRRFGALTRGFAAFRALSAPFHTVDAPPSGGNIQ